MTIPQGVEVLLLLAAGNRDPRRFADPDRFWPQCPDNAHPAFTGGIQYCLGAVLARMEAQVALAALAHRLRNPRWSTPRRRIAPTPTCATPSGRWSPSTGSTRSPASAGPTIHLTEKSATKPSRTLPQAAGDRAVRAWVESRLHPKIRRPADVNRVPQT
nr:cytochrome P450 [Streptomyces sp. RPT161]